MPVNYRAEWTFKHPTRRGLRMHVVVSDKTGRHVIAVEQSLMGMGRRVLSRLNCAGFALSTAPVLMDLGHMPDTKSAGALAHGVYRRLSRAGWSLCGFRATIGFSRGTIDRDYIAQPRQALPDHDLVDALLPAGAAKIDRAPTARHFVLAR